jgi:hypothetical protein
VDVPTI